MNQCIGMKEHASDHVQTYSFLKVDVVTSVIQRFAQKHDGSLHQSASQ